MSRVQSNHTLSGKLIFMLAATAALALLGAAPEVSAQATITVTSTAQEATQANPNGIVNGNCTLGEAIIAANTDAAVDACTAGQGTGTDSIMLPAGTFLLTAAHHAGFFFGSPVGLPNIITSMILQGAGATSTILEHVAGANFSLVTISATSPATIRDLTIRGFPGDQPPDNSFEGALLVNAGGLILMNVVVENNIAMFTRTAAINNDIFGICPPVTIDNSLFRNNTDGGGAGGALRLCGALTITNSTFLQNTTPQVGGAIAFHDGTANISNSAFLNNTAAGGAAVLVNAAAAILNISNSLISGNTNTANCGSGTVSGSGCLGSAGTTPGPITITGSTFVNNTGGDGAAVGAPFGGVLTITNSTFVGHAGNGTINHNGMVTLNNVTVTGNATVGVTGPASVQNSILAGNPGGDCSGITSLGRNVFGDLCGIPAGPGDQFGTSTNLLNPLLQALANNGSTVMAGANIPGVTSPMVVQTMALFTGSPALNMGDPGVPGSGGTACAASDQRGLTRPGGAQCDVGAFEDQTGAGIPTAADVGVTKTDLPDPVNVNSNLTYTITVTNAGPDLAANTAMNDPLPATVNFVSLTAPAGWTCTTPAVGATGTVNCTRAALPAGANDMFTLVVTPTVLSPASISNTATVSTLANDGNTGNNSAMTSTAVTGLNADLAVTKADTPDPITLGAGDITYAIALTNNGPGAATSVMLSDPLPASVNFVSLAAAAGWACTAPAVGATGTVSCTNASVAASSTHNFTVVVTPTTTGTINNTVTVAATETDPNPADNSASASTAVTAQADLSVTKTDAPDPINLGTGNVTYTVTVANAGPSPATGVVLTDTLPASATFVSATAPCTQAAGTVTCNLGAVASSANIVLTIVITPTTAGALNNSANVSSGITDPNAANNSASASTTVNPAANVAVAVADAPDPVNAGANVTYTVTVSNAGPSPATAVVLTNTLPAGVTFVSSTPSAGTCNAPAAGSFTCNLGTINSGANVTVPVVVMTTGATAASITNSATTSAAEFDPSAANNTNSATTTVTPVANLGVTVTDAPDPVAQGSNITYTITVTNAGPSPATGVTATAPVPANVTFVSGTATQGTCTQAAGTITCTIGTMASGATVTATIVVLTTAAGTVNASVNVTSAVTDPTPANNSANASTTVNAPAAADFTIAVSPASASLQGNQQSATFALTFAPTPMGSSFSNAIALTCFATPATAVTCSATPNSVTPGSASATSTLTVTRIVNSPPPGTGSAAPPMAWPRLPSSLPQWAAGTLPALLVALTVAALLLLRPGPLTRWRATQGQLRTGPCMAGVRGLRGTVSPLRAHPVTTLGMLLVLALLLSQSACKKEGSLFRGQVVVTVTGTSGAVSHSTSVTITVQ